MRVFDLQGTFTGARAPAENLQDEPGAVQHLGAERLLEIALLHWRERAIHHHDADLARLDQTGELVDLALAEIGRGADRAQRRDALLDHLEVDRGRKPDRLLEARFIAARALLVARAKARAGPAA